ncbi:universal stress protein [Desulfallas sp. Bu1-1]|uniref:universal stress protein n=1 Tax=Desulfallas sp. Bu1-1 TaxID=2787620 RepID=UPI00189F5B50|nr:universal stress protein [Desulfallas sp. Bu1-1]MBF7083800.1 universal stress protein [Desulfallas sp. Bu1-1]
MKILVPLDGSENSMRAVEYALSLAKKCPGVKVGLISVVYPFTSTQAGTSMEKARELFTREGVKVSTEILEGDPAETIIKYVNDHGIDTVIMGSRGMGALRGMVLGSVSYKVLGNVHVPVTIVK